MTRNTDRKEIEERVSNPDSDIIFKIRKYLRKEYKIPLNQSKPEYTIKIMRKNYEILGKLNYEEISQIRGIRHTPDIIVTDKDDKLWFIIEHDGKIHDSEEHKKKDKIRNSHYDSAGIKYIVLNTKEIKTEGDIPAAYLDRELQRIGIVKST